MRDYQYQLLFLLLGYETSRGARETKKREKAKV